VSSSGDLGVQVLDPFGHRGQRELRGGGLVGELSRPRPGGNLDPPGGGQVPQLVPHVVRGGVDQRLQLVDRLHAGLHRAAPGGAQQPDRLDRPLSGAGLPSPTSARSPALFAPATGPPNHGQVLPTAIIGSHENPGQLHRQAHRSFRGGWTPGDLRIPLVVELERKARRWPRRRGPTAVAFSVKRFPGWVLGHYVLFAVTSDS